MLLRVRNIKLALVEFILIMEVNLSSEAGQTILKDIVTAEAEAIKLETDQRVFSEKQ